ncbi:cytochrome b [Stutzerimonas nosocomialis]|uniref:Cytochrome b n=1 Tax=Stutzerimonas nosocomialis TaxID=1056496 RepID=A0A5R9R041_9GAMM|nr:cytochrome b [Stutzerimonas nosocomialis]TLX57281.1 cytochrome b [Stutzerimonas nosocomialis]TLX64225.1 cytochrome b [Stutzerimonas nosocomialis]
MQLPRYTATQIGFHWISALLVLLIIALPYGSGLIFESLLGGRGEVFTLHKSLGVAVLVLTVLRLCYRGRKVPAQALKPEESIAQQRAAKVGHGLLYLLLLVMPISGLMFGSRPFSLFWLVEIGPLPLSSDVRGIAKEVHLISQYLLFALILGHAAIALWHHYVRRDDVLKGMLPFLR